jgi:hypothetical protein
MAGSNYTTNELGSYCVDLFNKFKDARRYWEIIWEECFWNFLGEYQPNLRWRRETEGQDQFSRIFVKLTTLKCNTAHARITDALFKGRDLPFSYDPLDETTLGLDKISATKITAEVRRNRMDHFKKIGLRETLSSATLELAIMGTAVIKGPIMDSDSRPVVKERMIGGIPASEFGIDELQSYDLTTEVDEFHTYAHVPLLEYYVDPNAKKPSRSIAEMQFTRMLPAEFMQFKNLPGYDPEKVKTASKQTAVHTDEDDDGRRIYMGDNLTGNNAPKDSKINVLDFWGLVPAGMLRAEGVKDIPDDIEDDDQVEANVVLGGDGVVLRAVYNDLKERPFYVCPYKEVPFSCYGHGVAWSMLDSQKIINSSARLIIDNKAMSGVGMTAINLDKINTRRTKNLKVYPRKTWFLKGTANASEAIQPVVFPDITRGLQELMTQFERFADEETGIPKYSHAQQTSFLNKTATGMSMLMGAMNINLKPVLENIDEYWIVPIVQSDYEWYMSMEEGPKIPLKVKAKGTESLIAKELRLDNLMKAMQVSNNPQDSAYLNRDKIMHEVFDILDVSDVVRSEEEIEAQRQQQQEAMGDANQDTREFIQFDRLYPQLHRAEQIQLLEMLDIKPAEMVQQEMQQVQEEQIMQEMEQIQAAGGVPGMPGQQPPDPFGGQGF